MTDVIRADTLIGYNVSPDGATVRLRFSEQGGGSGTIEVPSQLVNDLLINLPRVAEEARDRTRRHRAGSDWPRSSRPFRA